MTDSDSLRGDPNYDPTRRHHPELRELDTLRALLRPRMTEEGDPTPTDALRGMFVEIERLRTMEGRRRPMDEAIIADNENAIARLTGELAAERKLAAAAATGHDHARGLLVAIAEVFGSVDDLDSLPAKVRELDDNYLHNCNKAERLQASIDEMDKARVLRAAETATERKDIETSLTMEAAMWCTANAGRGLAAELANDAAKRLLASLDTIQKPTIRTALSRALHVSAEVALAWAETHYARVVSRARDEEAARAAEARKHLETVAAEDAVDAVRWTKICEALGFDPEQDPPVSIPAILVGNRWTNTRRMLADACAKLQAPSLEMVLGELIQALSKAHKAASDPRTTVLPASISELHESTCPELDEPCHVRIGKPRYTTSDSRLQVWVIEPVALPAYQISGRGASWQWNAELAGIKYAISGYETATDAIAGARAHNDHTTVALHASDMPAPGRARCPVCHRMAPVKDGCFQPHTSGESTCSGSAGQTGLLRAWREWIIVKDAGLHSGLFDSELRAKFDEHATEARRLTDERIDALQKHVGDLAEALNEKTAALDAVPAQLAALKDTADAAHAAMRRLGWDGSTYPDEWAIACALSNVHRTAELRTLREKVGVLEAQLAAAGEDTDEIEAVREAIGVPAGKPLMSYVVHAAAGMQALAILGWQDGHPVEWATKRAAAEADLRGAFAEAELVGSDHAAMVRQLWGNLQSKSAQHLAAIEERNAQVDECAILRTVITERNARVHQLEIDNSKVHLEGRIELAEKRVATWRAWVVGMCPADLAHANMSDDGLRASKTYVPASALENVQAKLRDALDGLDNWRIWAESFGFCPVRSSVADLQGAIRASWNRLKARNEKLIGLVGVLRSIKQLVAVDLSP